MKNNIWIVLILNFSHRLGPKTFVQRGRGRGRGGAGRGGGRGRGQGQQNITFNVTGLGNVQAGFDARQKLSKANTITFGQPKQVAHVQGHPIVDIRQKIHATGQPIQDARQKILAKTKFSDARTRIESKKSEALIDARSKINANTKKTDARQLIKAKQQQKQQQQQKKQGPLGGFGTQILVTGQGRVMTNAGHSGVVAGPDGSLVKIVKTISGQASSMVAGSLAGNIFKTVSWKKKRVIFLY